MKSVVIFFLVFVTFLFPQMIFAENDVVLKSGISVLDNIPDEFWGAWRIKSKLIETSSKGSFKSENLDLWNISRVNDVISLENPFSKAKASISIKEVNGNKVVFEKSGTFNNKKLYDVVELNIVEHSFTGYNYLRLDTVSDIDGRILESQTAKYSLIGDKISGYNVIIEE